MARRRRSGGGRRGLFGMPSNWGWILALGLAGAAIYSADVFGIRTKVLDPIVGGTIGKVG